MKKIRETITTILKATRYSFGFCWRNSKGDTFARIMISLATTVVMYLGIQSTGIIINGVQKELGKVDNYRQVVDILTSGLVAPVVFWSVVTIFGELFGPLKWYFRNKWNHKLRFANQRELTFLRSTLDIARIRSKEFDDLERRIQELPTSWQTRIWFSDELFNLFVTMVSFVLFGTALLWYKPIYAFILVLVGIPMMIVEFDLVSKWWTLFQEQVPLHKKRSVLEQPFRGDDRAFIQARTFNQMSPLLKEIDINVGEVLDNYDKLRKTSIRNKMFAHLVAVLGLCFVVALAVWSTITHSVGIGTLTIIIASAKTFQGNLESIVSTIAEQWNSAKGVILIEEDFLGMKPLLKTEYPVNPDPSVIPTIRFDKVCFTYPGSEAKILKDVSFTIEPGSKVAIVGTSGAGKSTLVSLFMRHYDPTSGSISAGGVDLRNIRPEDWNRVVSALSQEYVVLSRLVGEEIASSRLGEPINTERVLNSCKFANFDEVVDEDEKGLNAQIGTEFGGREFSGGQKQRLALARVHYRRTPVLILDEPDAKLDPVSAQKVIDAVFALTGVTVIMITHHVSRAERCDQVIVMGKGKVVEQGTHAELMALGGAYVRLRNKDRERLGAESSSDLI